MAHIKKSVSNFVERKQSEINIYLNTENEITILFEYMHALGNPTRHR